MNVSSMDVSLQSAEQYRIRAKTEELQKSQAEEQQLQEQKVQQEITVDEYDKDNPVGEEVEGIYSVSHDDEGNLKVNYVQPSPKDEQSAKTVSAKSNETSSAQSAQSAPSTDTSSDNEDEIEELEEQKNVLQQKLSREKDDAVKAEIRTQILSVEAQIIQLKTAS